MPSPEFHIGKIPIRLSVAGIVEQEGKLLLVREVDGYGPPAGHCEPYECYYPKSTMFWELAEETQVLPTFNMNLWGIMVQASRDKISVGLVYRLNEVGINDQPISDPEIFERAFFDKDQIEKIINYWTN